MSGSRDISFSGQLATLRPTQMTVGLDEVNRKREEWRQRSSAERDKSLARNTFPAVRGINDRQYITDHHHLGLALLREGVETVQLALEGDLSNLAEDEFWIVMEHNQWVHTYDADGVRRNVSELPASLLGLADDPYRSLAAEVRRAGGFQKDLKPFAEFLWADFFRRRVPADLLRSDPQGALQCATQLARTGEASHLPGWSGG